MRSNTGVQVFPPSVERSARSRTASPSGHQTPRMSDEVPSGLLLANAPGVLEDLLLGSVAADEIEGVVSSVGMTRWRATRILAASARKR